MGAVSPYAQQTHSCGHHSLIKIDGGWLIFCPVSASGKTLEMATSTIPWQSSAYSFLRDKRDRVRRPSRPNQWAPNLLIHRHVFSQWELQDPAAVTGSSREANQVRLACPGILPSYPSNRLLSQRCSHSQHCSLLHGTIRPISLSLLSDQVPQQRLHILRTQT